MLYDHEKHGDGVGDDDDGVGDNDDDNSPLRHHWFTWRNFSSTASESASCPQSGGSRLNELGYRCQHAKYKYKRQHANTNANIQIQLPTYKYKCQPGLQKLLQPCSRAARKWRENEEIKKLREKMRKLRGNGEKMRKLRGNGERMRKWIENEEMDRE